MGKLTQEFIAKNKTPIVLAKRVGMGALVGLQQIALEQIDSKRSIQTDDFLALQNLVPLIETGILIPLSVMTKNAAIRSVSSSLLVGTTTMTTYRVAKMAMPFIANQMRSIRAKTFNRSSGFSRQTQQNRVMDISPMSLGLFSNN